MATGRSGIAGKKVEDGWTHEDHGLARNRPECMPGFGSDFGPYGQELSDEIANVTVLPIADGSPVLLVFEGAVPVFEAYNPLQVVCA